jgi:hypothetical protein
MKFTIILSVLIAFVKSEGYTCNFDSLASYGETSQNILLYSYYDKVGNTYIKRGEYGFESQVDYCTQKGDATLHPNEDLQVKCNDSRNICIWENNSCVSTGTSQCSSLELCQTVLNGGEAACLGQDCVNDPNGGSNDFLYAEFCNGSTPTNTSTSTDTSTPTDAPTTVNVLKTEYINDVNGVCLTEIVYVSI